jgi:UDP-N-acetylmuramate dehydrogenase
MSLRDRFGDRLLLNEPLGKYTAARLGGPAEMVYKANRSTDELVEIVSAAWAEGVPVRILGGGANVLISDQGVRGLVVVNHVSTVEMLDGGLVSVASGMSLSTLARRLAARGLSGFEWAVSVPGTVGGAVVNNAGAHGGDVAGCIDSVTLLDTSLSPRLLRKSDLDYSYRTSSLKRRTDRRFLVLAATFAFTPDDLAQISARMEANIAHRKRTQPPGASLGSIFKNPPGDYAGRLIESAGLKGFQIGGAQVSPIHANFFINTGRATSSDYYALIRTVRDKVAQHSGIVLEMEVELLGDGFE